MILNDDEADFYTQPTLSAPAADADRKAHPAMIPITDDEVEKAAEAAWNTTATRKWHEIPGEWKPHYRDKARAALEASRAVIFPADAGLRPHIDVLRKALRDDPDYRNGWIANIAMSIIDELAGTVAPKDLEPYDKTHAFANRAADRFLRILEAS